MVTFKRQLINFHLFKAPRQAKEILVWNFMRQDDPQRPV